MDFSGKDLNEKNLYPSPTARNGRVRANSARDGRGQGRGNPDRFVHCAQCGFVVNKTITDKSGGSRNGNGGYGKITKTVTGSVDDLTSDTFTDGTTSRNQGHGEQVVKRGAACPMCGSKNFLGGK